MNARLSQNRVRARQRLFLFAGAVLFAAYYAAFFAFGVYTPTSVGIGLVMAAGLGGAGWAVTRVDPRQMRALAIGIAALLAVGATCSAAYSHGSECLGFHTVWALPLIYGLFIQDQWEGSVTVAVLCVAGGLTVLISEGAGLSRIVQWSTLAVSAGVFGYLQQASVRREHALHLADYKKAQSQLALADRMASIGMLAAGVAHEINNPLSFVSTNVEFVHDKLDGEARDRSELTDALSDAMSGCDRVTAIVRTLGRLSRAEGSAAASVDVNRAVADVIQLSRRDLENIATVQYVPSDLSPIPGDEARLGQVFLNLLVNAAHAIEDRAEGPRAISVRTFARGQDKIVVEVADAGCGIPPTEIQQIFEPTFTTKATGRGTGLGLPLCAEIVEEHSGTIEVESTRGIGSVFRVVLPTEPTPSAQARA